jgi:hypothetical protein
LEKIAHSVSSYSSKEQRIEAQKRIELVASEVLKTTNSGSPLWGSNSNIELVMKYYAGLRVAVSPKATSKTSASMSKRAFSVLFENVLDDDLVSTAIIIALAKLYPNPNGTYATNSKVNDAIYNALMEESVNRVLRQILGFVYQFVDKNPHIVGDSENKPQFVDLNARLETCVLMLRGSECDLKQWLLGVDNPAVAEIMRAYYKATKNLISPTLVLYFLYLKSNYNTVSNTLYFSTILVNRIIMSFDKEQLSKYIVPKLVEFKIIKPLDDKTSINQTSRNALLLNLPIDSAFLNLPMLCEPKNWEQAEDRLYNGGYINTSCVQSLRLKAVTTSDDLRFNIKPTPQLVKTLNVLQKIGGPIKRTFYRAPILSR